MSWTTVPKRWPIVPIWNEKGFKVAVEHKSIATPKSFLPLPQWCVFRAKLQLISKFWPKESESHFSAPIMSASTQGWLLAPYEAQRLWINLSIKGLCFCIALKATDTKWERWTVCESANVATGLTTDFQQVNTEAKLQAHMGLSPWWNRLQVAFSSTASLVEIADLVPRDNKCHFPQQPLSWMNVNGTHWLCCCAQKRTDLAC